MSAIFKSLRWAGAAAALAFCASSFSQTFEAPSCGTGSSDSTCYTINGGAPSSCVDPHSSSNDPLFVNASQQTVCGGAGYYGSANQDGHRNICTGATTWLPLNTMDERCTSCPTPLTASENQAMVGATIELAESVNLALSNMASSGFSSSMLDGTVVKNPATDMALGRYFREHVWVSPEAFTSNQLPAVPRLNYLASIGQLPANLPTWIPQLPLDPQGNPISNTGTLYKMMLKSVIAAGTVTCSGNDASHCDISCTSPAGGWLGSLCATENVQYYSCSDSYAVYSGGTWIPTPNATVPFTSSAASGAGDYTMKTTDWGTIFGWNGLSERGGTLFMCDSTIAACNGWVTESYVYQCRTPATIDCSYSTFDSAGDVLNVAATCVTCDVAKGAVWDYWLTQQNDCPATPVSTRSSDTRNIWLSDMGSCPVLAGPTGPQPISPTCPAGQMLDASGATCVSKCVAPSTWDAATSSCVAPAPPAPTPPPTPAPVPPGTQCGAYLLDYSYLITRGVLIDQPCEGVSIIPSADSNLVGMTPAAINEIRTRIGGSYGLPNADIFTVYGFWIYSGNSNLAGCQPAYRCEHVDPVCPAGYSPVGYRASGPPGYNSILPPPSGYCIKN